MPRARCSDQPLPEFVTALEQFNQGRFFEQHETLEMLWRNEFGRLRGLYQGILQVGVGFHHLKRGNYNGAVHLLERGLSRLAAYAPACQGVDVARLISETRRCYEQLLSLGAQHLDAFDWSLVPQVHWTSGTPPTTSTQPEHHIG
jgi:hypothetical protein